jgi:hypothetical protein
MLGSYVHDDVFLYLVSAFLVPFRKMINFFTLIFLPMLMNETNEAKDRHLSVVFILFGLRNCNTEGYNYDHNCVVAFGKQDRRAGRGPRGGGLLVTKIRFVPVDVRRVCDDNRTRRPACTARRVTPDMAVCYRCSLFLGRRAEETRPG